jgi:hypothetical protein
VDRSSGEYLLIRCFDCDQAVGETNFNRAVELASGFIAENPDPILLRNFKVSGDVSRSNFEETVGLHDLGTPEELAFTILGACSHFPEFLEKILHPGINEHGALFSRFSVNLRVGEHGVEHSSDFAYGIPKGNTNTRPERKGRDDGVRTIRNLKIADSYDDFTQGFSRLFL